HCHSAYSFLDGASHPEELAARAAELGYDALALTDHDGLSGSLEFAHAAKAFGVRPITGAEVTLADGSHITLLVETPQGYANLCRLLTAAHAGTRPKPTELLPPGLDRHLLAAHDEGLVCLSGCAELAERLEFDLTEELGYRYPDFSDRDEPAIAELTRVCNHAFEARYRLSNSLLQSQARSRLDEELALIGELGLAGFFLLHWEVLQLAADVAREVRGRNSPRHSLPPGRGRGSSVGSLVCYL